jgi:hypothetical protein
MVCLNEPGLPPIGSGGQAMIANKVKWLALLLGGAGWLAVTAAACGNSSSTPESAAGSAAAAGGGEGGGAHQPSAGGLGAEAGEAAVCNCASYRDLGYVPLECASLVGLRVPLEPQFPKHYPVYMLGLPYTVVFGTCASGYHRVEYSEACEGRGVDTYDAQNELVYSEGYYRSDGRPTCGSSPGTSVPIGKSDPARDCDYCVVTAEGLGGESSSCMAQELAMYPPCDAPGGGAAAGGGAGQAGQGGAR